MNTLAFHELGWWSLTIGYRKRMTELKSQRRIAVSQGEIGRANELDAELEATRKEWDELRRRQGNLLF